MEESNMDAGAMISFLTLGIQSAKIIYAVISAVKDGPDKLHDLRSAVSSL